MEVLADFLSQKVSFVPFKFSLLGNWQIIPSDWVVDLLGLPSDLTIGQLLIGVGLVAILEFKLAKLIASVVLRL